jgi:hypothetical protein
MAWAEAMRSQAAFFRMVSTNATEITALGADGSVVWSNAAAGGTGLIQRATTVLAPEGWIDYVQCLVTGTVMSLRLFDPSPPDGITLIPAGTNSGTDPDFGEYSLTVPGFYMDRAHVTKALWDRVRTWAATNGYTDLPAGGGHGVSHPVFDVSWHEAVKWCNARSEMEQRPAVYRVAGEIYRAGESNTVACDFSVAGYRLPTMVEWEYAARGGLRGKRYPWGDEIDETKLNFNGTLDKTTSAGTYPPNGYDLCDMAGNVWAWTWDWHPAHVNEYRSIRGGSWHDQAFACRCGVIGFHRPSGRNYTLGFRTVLPSCQP